MLGLGEALHGAACISAPRGLGGLVLALFSKACLLLAACLPACVLVHAGVVGAQHAIAALQALQRPAVTHLTQLNPSAAQASCADRFCVAPWYHFGRT